VRGVGAPAATAASRCDDPLHEVEYKAVREAADGWPTLQGREVRPEATSLSNALGARRLGGYLRTTTYGTTPFGAVTFKAARHVG